MRPEAWTDESGVVHVRCDAEGERAVSERVGDGSKLDLFRWLIELADLGELEVDDSVDGQVTISIPPGE
jgi:hypothetical protein